MTQRQNLARMAAIQTAQVGRRQQLELMKLGGGPWRILPDCPAIAGHNTVNAARGVGAQGLRCICPRGTYLFAEYRKAEKQRRAATGGHAGRTANAGLSRIVPPIGQLLAVRVPPRGPDYRAAACRGFEKIVDAAYGNDDGVQAGAYRAAKQLCARCPITLTCGGNVMQNEPKPGDWGGVWGGMSPADRTRLSKTPEYKAFQEAK